MQTPLLVIAAVVALGLLYVVVPVISGAYLRYRGVKKTVCPETGGSVEVMVDAGHAAATAALGKPDLRVHRCSRWPERHDCDQSCTAQL